MSFVTQNKGIWVLKTLRNPKDPSIEDLENCVDNAIVGCYAGDIRIKENQKPAVAILCRGAGLAVSITFE
jgi:hypothetical protein